MEADSIPSHEIILVENKSDDEPEPIEVVETKQNSSTRVVKRKRSDAKQLMINAFKKARSSNSWVKDDINAFLSTGFLTCNICPSTFTVGAMKYENGKISEWRSNSNNYLQNLRALEMLTMICTLKNFLVVQILSIALI